MMKNLRRNLWGVFIAILLCPLSVLGQSVVTGTIVDKDNAPLPGVNVLVKGTSRGTATDVEGKFSLQASPDNVLVFSFIGYKNQEVIVGTQSSIAITLEEDVTALGEVIVIGYGEQKKVLNTGANLQIEGDALQKQSSTNALQALQGQAPGVQITATSGQPGSSINVTVRGLGSTIGNTPLYIVDGVIVSDINYLNNSDIASLTVLKDAASTAIYGSQAASGVVLVTTKKGKAGRAQITFDGFYGVQSRARKVDLLNAQEYATLRNESLVNSGAAPFYTNEQIAAMGTGTDWMKEMFVDNAPTQNYSIGISGGTEASTYSSSVSYLSQVGIVGGKDLSDYKRYNFRFNSEHKLYKDLITFGQNLSFALTDNLGITVGNQYNNSLRAAFLTTPLLANDPNDHVGIFSGNQSNPYYAMVYNNQNTNSTEKLVGNMYLLVEPIKNLKFRTSLGIDYTAYDGQGYKPEYTLSAFTFNATPSVSQTMNKGKTIMWDNLLSYGLTVAQKHNIDFMLGSTVYRNGGSTLFASRTAPVFNDLDHAYVSNGTSSTAQATGTAYDPDHRLSFFGRVNYNFEEKYLFNATFRADGSSKFSNANRWGYFPSVSAGWVISNEEFLQNTSNWLNSFKLRASWGQVGSQNVAAFQYQAPITSVNSFYNFGPDQSAAGLTSGAYPNRIANPNLKWETSEQTDIGFDAQFLNGHLTANFDWYNKVNKNWLINAPILASAGANPPYINGGSVTNRGIELALTYNNSVGDLHYRVSANTSYNKNKVGQIPNADGIIHGLTAQLYDNAPEFNRVSNGNPMGYFWGYKTSGIFQNQAEIDSYVSNGKVLQPTAHPGDVKFVDVDGNGVIDNNDKTNIGKPNPSYTFGFSIAADYKGFDLSVQASGVQGNQIVQSYRNLSNGLSNYTTAILSRWHGEGTSNTMPRVTETNENWVNFSDLYIHNGDYLRINNVTLGYDFKRLMKTKAISQCRFYVSALNLATFTKYNGMDPEIGYGPSATGTTGFTSGVDLGYYPRPRTYMVGVNVKF